jgi:tryptophanyl-tRNA synthetase
MVSQKNISKPRLLTGDTPTGKLHLGHWVGSVENRVRLQDQYDCYFLLANIHAFTTRADRPAEIRQSVLDITVDYLAAGIDPQKSVIFIESEVPAIYTLASLFSMLIPFPRLMRNPTLKDEIRDKKLGDNYSFGFLLYSVLQVADILAFLPKVVPVGEDQLPHLEMTREVARHFNQRYCGVDPHTEDADYQRAGGLLPVITPLVGRVDRLIGLGPPTPEGRLLKMSKSLDNAILLSDDADTVAKKVMGMYTDPHRIRATDPGTVENNPLWIFHDIFNPDKAWVEQTKDQYRSGQIGDVTCKKKLIDVLNALLDPIRRRRLDYQNDLAQVLQILKNGADRANAVAEKTLIAVKAAIRQDF